MAASENAGGKSMGSKVHYDFAAADELSRQLGQLVAKLEWLLWLRSTQRSALLGDPGSDKWKGKRRTQFERTFAAEQARLRSLVDQAQRTRSSVDTATAAAHTLLKTAQ